MSFIIQDIRYGIRSLLRRPAFTVIAVITLAIGIGANTAIFSVVDATLLRQLPYPESERLVMTNSPSILVPSADMIWPRMSLLPSEELTVSVHTTTMFPFDSSARPGDVPALDPILTVPASVEMST